MAGWAFVADCRDYRVALAIFEQLAFVAQPNTNSVDTAYAGYPISFTLIGVSSK
jgi:hypothetical protein